MKKEILYTMTVENETVAKAIISFIDTLKLEEKKYVNIKCESVLFWSNTDKDEDFKNAKTLLKD